MPPRTTPPAPTPTPPSSQLTPPAPARARLACDLCGEEARTFDLDPRAPDVLCCANCATLTPAQVARRDLAAAWPRGPRTGAACRSGACAGCV